MHDLRRADLPGLAWLGGLLACCCCLAAPVRADNLDRALFKQHADKIIQVLKDKNYHQVGVLKFLVKLGNGKPSLSVGAMNVTLAERLENALVLRLQEEDGVQVIHDAGQVLANAKQRLSYLKKKDRAKFFDFKFPLAWGRQRVKPDVFLTGCLRLLPKKDKRQEVSVQIVSFDRKAPEEMVDVLTFRMPVDANILTDLGRARRSRDGGALGDFDDESDGKPDTETAPTSRIELRVAFGKEQHTPRLDPVPGNPLQERVPEPDENQTVKFFVRNLSRERLAIVLKVNGVSTLDATREEAALSRMWVLQPNRKYVIDGTFLQKSGATHRMIPFKAVSEKDALWEAMRTDLTDAGTIQLTVFKSGKRSTPEPKPPRPDPKPPKKEMKITLRGLARGRQERSLNDLRKKLANASKRGSTARSGIIPDAGKEEDRALQKEDFSDPEQVENRVILYWAKK